MGSRGRTGVVSTMRAFSRFFHVVVPGRDALILRRSGFGARTPRATAGQGLASLTVNDEFDRSSVPASELPFLPSKNGATLHFAAGDATPLSPDTALEVGDVVEFKVRSLRVLQRWRSACRGFARGTFLG